MTKVEHAIQAIKISIDSTNPEETRLIADLYLAIELLKQVGA